MQTAFFAPITYERVSAERVNAALVARAPERVEVWNLERRGCHNKQEVNPPTAAEVSAGTSNDLLYTLYDPTRTRSAVSSAGLNPR